MPTFRLQIKCDNAAFGEGPRLGEVSRILYALSQRLIIEPDDSGLLFDMNGNRVGSYTLTGGKS